MSGPVIGTGIGSGAAPATATGTAAGIAAVRRALGRRARRRMLVNASLGLALLAIALLTLALGTIPISPLRLVETLIGRGDPLSQLVVFTLRLPRWSTAVLVGAAFALAGSLFQSTLRNPLATPDLLGVSGGASLGAVVAVLLWHRSGALVPLMAFAGALLVAALVAALAWRRGSGGAGAGSGLGFGGQRFVLIGIALAFLVSGGIGYLFTRADVREAAGALIWTVGSVSSPSWSQVALLAIALAVLGPLVFALGRPLRALALGADAARGLGARPGLTAAAALLLGVCLAALAASVAGPVAFVAFVSAPIARRMVGAGGLEPLASALSGAVLVSGSDWIAQHLPGGFDAPVGLVTALVGAPYLLWLLAASRKGETV